MRSTGAFRERLLSAWIDLRENPGRSALQALGITLGVASVLGGFSISDSQRRQAERIFARIGGIDKVNVRRPGRRHREVPRDGRHGDASRPL